MQEPLDGDRPFLIKFVVHMRLLRESQKTSPKVSIILLDWSVRESFHLFSYLANQTVSQDQFEVLIVEYYDRISPALAPYRDQIDTWLLLEMPKSCYYHKHLMYNVGIALARGEIVVICDSDAMVKPTFIQSIIEAFEQKSNLVLHLDQFRNYRRDFYPFNWPTFEQVLGEGAANNINGKTKGVVSNRDFIHRRNYGACFCARRADLVAIQGADEHIDYAGHICGPYEMTFRLVNAGKEIQWHEKEFLYHTWHPGTDGVANYCGPHDGLGVSSTAIDLIHTGQSLPHVPNPMIAEQAHRSCSFAEIEGKIITPRILRETDLQLLSSKNKIRSLAQASYKRFLKRGIIYRLEEGQAVRHENNLNGPSPVRKIQNSLSIYGIFVWISLQTALSVFAKIADRPLKKARQTASMSYLDSVLKMKKAVATSIAWIYRCRLPIIRRYKQVEQVVQNSKIFYYQFLGNFSTRGFVNMGKVSGGCVIVCSPIARSAYEAYYKSLGKDISSARWLNYPTTQMEWDAFIEALRQTRCALIHRNEFVETVSRIPLDLRTQSTILSL